VTNEVGFADLLMWFLMFMLGSCSANLDVVMSCKDKDSYQAEMFFMDMEKLKCEVVNE